MSAASCEAFPRPGKLRRVYGLSVPPTALRLTDEIAAAAAKNDAEAVKTAVPKLQQICGNCHTAYRERLDDGSYRYRQSTK